MRTAVAALVAVPALLLAGCGGDDEAAAPETTTPVTTDDRRRVRERRGARGARRRRRDSADRAARPRADVDARRSRHRAARSSSRSTWTSAPATSASLVSLAETGFFDDTVFHRIVPGLRDPGRRPDPVRYRAGPATRPSTCRRRAPGTSKGVVAMAKTGAEPAGTAGSQFFVVTGDDIGLPPEYAVVGEVTEGLDVVELIGTLGDPATEQPRPADRRRVGHRRVELTPMGRDRRGRPRRGRRDALRRPEAAPAAPARARARRARARSTRSSWSRARTTFVTPSSQGGARLVRCPDWERGPGRVAPLRARRAGRRRRGGGRDHGGRARPLARRPSGA